MSGETEADMKIQIECDESVEETQVLIRCRELNEHTTRIGQMLAEEAKQEQRFVFYQGDTTVYLSLNDILFLETDGKQIQVHTCEDIYQTKYKLYELEEMLPGQFMRVSKSAILNTRHVYSITKNISSSSVVQFRNSYKQVYVSRMYYKPLKSKLEEKRIRE